MSSVTTELHTNEASLEVLLHLFDHYRIPHPTEVETSTVTGNIHFSIPGPRDSVAIYRIWGRGIADVWFGKANDDSGGRAMQGQIPTAGSRPDEQFGHILKLHQRFLQSGRRKVLRSR